MPIQIVFSRKYEVSRVDFLICLFLRSNDHLNNFVLSFETCWNSSRWLKMSLTCFDLLHDILQAKMRFKVSILNFEYIELKLIHSSLFCINKLVWVNLVHKCVFNGLYAFGMIFVDIWLIIGLKYLLDKFTHMHMFYDFNKFVDCWICLGTCFYVFWMIIPLFDTSKVFMLLLIALP